MKRGQKIVAGLLMVGLPASAVNQKREVKKIIIGDSKVDFPAKLYSGMGKPIELFIDGIRTTFGDRRPEFIIVPEEIPEVLRSPAREKR